MGTLAFGCLWQWDFLLPSLITRDVQRWFRLALWGPPLLASKKRWVFGSTWKPPGSQGKCSHSEAEPSEALRAAKEAGFGEMGMDLFVFAAMEMGNDGVVFCSISSTSITINAWFWAGKSLTAGNGIPILLSFLERRHMVCSKTWPDSYQLSLRLHWLSYRWFLAAERAKERLLDVVLAISVMADLHRTSLEGTYVIHVAVKSKCAQNHKITQIPRFGLGLPPLFRYDNGRSASPEWCLTSSAGAWSSKEAGSWRDLNQVLISP